MTLCAAHPSARGAGRRRVSRRARATPRFQRHGHRVKDRQAGDSTESLDPAVTSGRNGSVRSLAISTEGGGVLNDRLAARSRTRRLSSRPRRPGVARRRKRQQAPSPRLVERGWTALSRARARAREDQPDHSTCSRIVASTPEASSTIRPEGRKRSSTTYDERSVASRSRGTRPACCPKSAPTGVIPASGAGGGRLA